MITVLSTRTIDDGDRNHCEFLFTDGGGDEWEFCGTCPADVDPTEYWNREENLNLVANILSNKYHRNGRRHLYKTPVDTANLLERLAVLEAAANAI